MERLTIKGHTCDILRCTRFNCDGDHDKTQECDTKKYYERLREYENTGLTPEVCAEYKKFEDELVSSGKSSQHVLDLLAVEKDGRLVVLPCKVGDEVFEIVYDCEDNPDHTRLCYCLGKKCADCGKSFKKIMGFKSRTADIRSIVENMMLCGETVGFGKSVFLTREEAEAALGGEER